MLDFALTSDEEQVESRIAASAEHDQAVAEANHGDFIEIRSPHENRSYCSNNNLCHDHSHTALLSVTPASPPPHIRSHVDAHSPVIFDMVATHYSHLSSW